MTDPRPGEPSLSDCEAAHIVQETADKLADDLGIAWSEGFDILKRGIADAVERWRIYARGGEQRPKEPR